MRIVKVSVLISVLLFTSSVVFFKKEAIACEAISASHFEEIHPNVFTDSTVTNKQIASLLASITLAHERINQVYGEMSAVPRIIATNSLAYQKFGLNPTGMQSSGFARECVFLGSKGMNVDVIAHELVHAEVRDRTDLLTELVKLPAWFIEGTAIKVDYRAPFLIENIALTEQEITQIKSVFFLHDFVNTSVKSYQASRMAIEELEPHDLYSGLARLNKGESFEEVFGM